MTNESADVATLSPHKFLADLEISPADLKRIEQLTEGGMLAWVLNEEYAAYSGYPASDEAIDRQWASEDVIRVNIRGLRIGFEPGSKAWHYFRITSNVGNHFYVELGDASELVDIVDRIYALIIRAQRFAGRIGGPIEHCERCGNDTPHAYLVDRPYGLAGAVMGGSERKVCTVCEHVTPL